MSKKTGKKRTKLNQYDQYYTKEDVAYKCLDSINIDYINTFDIVIEPSAGTGNFIDAFKKKFPDYKGVLSAYDIDPKTENIKKQDYLKLDTTEFKDKKVFVFGNPPFGQNSTLAKKFIKKSCEYATVIAFILSSSFKKESMNKVFDSYFWLIQEVEIEEDAFIVDDKSHNVDCIFQVWEKRDKKRNLKVKKRINSTKFKYIKVDEKPDFSFRRVGAKAGTASLDLTVSAQSNHFIKLNNPVDDINELIAKINKIDWGLTNKKGTYPSLSKGQITEKLEELL
jgi:predicted RNA methylase